MQLALSRYGWPVAGAAAIRSDPGRHRLCRRRDGFDGDLDPEIRRNAKAQRCNWRSLDTVGRLPARRRSDLIPAGTVYAGAAMALTAIWIRKSGEMRRRSDAIGAL